MSRRNWRTFANLGTFANLAMPAHVVLCEKRDCEIIGLRGIAQVKVKILESIAAVRSFFALVYRTFGVMEALLAIGLGALVSAWISLPDNAYLGWCALVTGVFYTPLIILKLRAQWCIPEKLFDHLDAVHRLEQTRKELARKEGIDAFIDLAIKSLNSATCRINSDQEDHICDSAVKDGLSDVLSSLINRPQIILDCDTVKFSIGARVFHYVQAGSRPIRFEHEWLVLRDDLGVGEEVPCDPADGVMSDATGTSLHFRQAIEKAVNENTLVAVATALRGKPVQLICSPIPVVCDEARADGVLWICRECIQPPPNDLGNILLIFGRVVANWLSKYHDCLGRKALVRSDPGQQESIITPEDPASEHETEIVA